MHSVSQSTPDRSGWLLPLWTLCFMCGILLGRTIVSAGIMFGPLILGLCAAWITRRWRRVLALLLTGLSAGALLGWNAYHPALPAEGEYQVEGTITQEIALREDGQVQTLLSSVLLNSVPAPDAHWTFYLHEEEALPDWLTPGVRVSLTARVYHPAGQLNPGGFSFREYLLQRGIGIGLYGADDCSQARAAFSLQGWFAALRHRLTLALMDVMGPESGGYAAAMLLGARDFIPEDDRAVFSQLGIAHVLSISGFHVGVLISWLLLILRPLPLSRWLRVLLEALLLGFYSLLTGAQAPVVRAAALLLWREFTHLRHRQMLPLHALCITALMQLIHNPTLLTGVSFQLTYSAMLGLMLILPRFLRTSERLPFLVRKPAIALAVTFSAQLGLLLPQLYWFGELSLLSVFLNLAVIPLTSALISLYWFTLAALAIPGLNTLLGSLASRATSVLLQGIRLFGELDFGCLWTRQADWLAFIGWVMLLLGLSIILPHRASKLRRILCFTGSILLAAVLIPLPEKTVSYIQFSTGDADAAVLQDHSVTLVIDAGEDGRTVASYLHQQRQAVELLLITHLHIDHAGGIRALLDQGIPIKVCCLPWSAETPAIDEEALPLLDELRQTGTEIRYLHRGDVIPLPSGQLTVLWPEEGRVFPQHDANDVALVLQADLAGVTLLLPSDLSGPYTRYIACPADILKVPHHGSSADAAPEFLAAVHPQLLVLSNRSDAREAYMAEIAGGIPLYTTEHHGSITIRFHGNGEFDVHPFLHR